MTKFTDNATPEGIWADTLKRLQGQMTQATFSLFDQSAARAGRENSLIVSVKSEMAQEWLDIRLRSTIERTVAAVAGLPLHIEFAVNGSAPAKPKPTSPPAPNPADLPNQTVPGNVAGLAHYDLFQRQWAKHPRYLRFYPPYWATVNSYAGPLMLSVWQRVRDQFDLTRYESSWSPTLTFSAGEWPALTGVSYQRLFGVSRPCPAFDRAFEEGEQRTTCCESYLYLMHVLDNDIEWPQQTKATPGWPEGRPTCRHWVPGALEMLAAEKLAGVSIRGNTNDNEVRIQVYLQLPLLTPVQVDRLSPEMQAQHDTALTQELGVDMDTWRSITAERMTDIWQDMGGFRPNNGISTRCAIAHNPFFLRDS